MSYRFQALPALLTHVFAYALTLGCLCVLSAGAQTQATALPLLYPGAIAFDTQGNLYLAETGANAVRKVTPQGVVTTVAGNGVQGYSGDGGLATAAAFDYPAGLAVDAAGDLYIADSHNQRIREVDAATGVVTTVAGTGTAGFGGDGAAALAALLSRPASLALDASGTLYIADSGNHRVRRVDAASGKIATIAGSGLQGFSGDGGPATAAAIDAPDGLAVDLSGNLYLADTHNGRVRRVDGSTGRITTLAAGLALPRGVALDASGNVFVAETAGHRIRRIALDGTVTTAAGQGTEAFAGDGAPAVDASLDQPRSVAFTPGGLLTLADTGNTRVRQLDALPAPGPDIHTLAGVGRVSAGALVLNAPSVVAYGSGTVQATLAASTQAMGSVLLLDLVSGSALNIGSGTLQGDVASFSIGTLAAGVHQLVAVYAGDASHDAAQSAAVSLTVTPLAVTATPNAVSILYGQAVPLFNGGLNGVLAQDAGDVMAVFASSATAHSPAGTYAISASLTGVSAGNYVLATTPALLTIAKAPTQTLLSASPASAGLGASVSFSVQAASTTSGTPTGMVTLLDGTTFVATQTLVGGAATVTTAALSAGVHSVSAVYAGDGNFLPSSSPGAAVSVGTAPDFTLAVTGSSTQSVPAGSPATFAFSVQMQGAALASAISLAVQGVPLGATASMNPATIPPGGAVSAFTLTVQTPKLARAEPFGPIAGGAYAALAFLLLPPTMLMRSRLRLHFSVRSGILCGASFALCFGLSGCGNRVNDAVDLSSASSYTLTVTGSATSPSGTLLQHSVNVVLQVL